MNHRINNQFALRHGHARRADKSPTATYQAWVDMRRRCLKPTHPAYPLYGGRGIIVDAEWAADFAAFLRDMGPRPDGKSLDRIDNDGAYCKANCRWTDARTQAANRRTSRYLTINGETLTLIAWARRAGIGVSTVRERLCRGWAPERALSEPPRREHARR